MNMSAPPSSTLLPQVPVDISEQIIGNNLNSSMLFNLYMGIYTVVFIGTVCLYVSSMKPAQQRLVVLPAIIALYLIYSALFALNWYSVYWAIVLNGDTRQSVLLATAIPPSWVGSAEVMLQNSMNIVSNGVLIWRCHHVWNRRRRMIAIPSCLWITELRKSSLALNSYTGATNSLAVFSITTTTVSVLASSSRDLPGPLALITNGLIGGTYFASFATTVTTTLLIGYRISSTAKLSSSTQSFNRFTYIMHILFESAAAHSAVLLVNAIMSFVVTHKMNIPLGNAAINMQFILNTVAGMGPTLIVARICLNNKIKALSANIAPRITELQFGSSGDTSTRGDGTNFEIQGADATSRDLTLAQDTEKDAISVVSESVNS